MNSEVKVGQTRRWKLGRKHAANGLVFRVESVSPSGVVGVYQSEGHVGNQTHAPADWMAEKSEVVGEVYDPQKPFTLKVVVTPQHWARANELRVERLNTSGSSVCRDCVAGVAVNDALQQRFKDDQIYATCASGSANVRRVNPTFSKDLVLRGAIEQAVYHEDIPKELKDLVKDFDYGSKDRGYGPCPTFELRFNPSDIEQPYRPEKPAPKPPEPKKPAKLDVSKLKNPYLVVNVTAKDVAEARRHRSFNDQNEHWLGETCPVALAATRALRARFRRYPGIRAQVDTGRVSVAISPHPIGYDDLDKPQTYVAQFVLPPSLRETVRAFDSYVDGLVDTKVKPVRTVVRLVPRS